MHPRQVISSYWFSGAIALVLLGGCGESEVGNGRGTLDGTEGTGGSGAASPGTATSGSSNVGAPGTGANPGAATGGTSPGGAGASGGRPVTPPERPPAPGGLCTRCVDDKDCAETGSHCIELSALTAMGATQTFGERVCGADCATTACPEGYECRAVTGAGQQCWPKTNTCASGAGHTYGGYPRQIYLHYADGTGTPDVCKQHFGTAPPYVCEYGKSLDECKTLLKVELDRIFQGMNIDVVFEKPERVPYYHAFVDSNTRGMAGWSRFGDCKDRYVRTDAVECFHGGGHFLKAEASGVAHEVGHTMGLDHIAETTDLMNGSLGTMVNGVSFELNSDHFEDKEYKPEGCPGMQNSYRYALFTTGPRP